MRTFRLVRLCFATIVLTVTLVVIGSNAQDVSSEEATSTRPQEEDAFEVESIYHPLKPPDTLEFVETAATEGEAEPHPNEAINQPDFPPRVYFNDLNADSLNILVIYWYHPPMYWDYLEHAHWVNLQIIERFHAEGIDFAFPTQTLHLAGDDKRPLTVGQHWVTKTEGMERPTTDHTQHTMRPTQ